MRALINLLILSSILPFYYVSSQTFSTTASFSFDLQLKNCSAVLSPDQPSFNLQAVIYNGGTKIAKYFSFVIFSENGKNNSYDEPDDEIIYERDFDSLAVKDSIVIKTSFGYKGNKTKKIIFFIDYKEDMKQDNNTEIAYVSNPLPSYSILINEIMFNPLIGNPEYIELYNTTNDTINLCNWAVADQYLSNGKRNEILISGDHFINPKTYFTLSSDSSILNYFTELRTNINSIYSFNRASLNLNNDEDEIVLLDINRNVQDSLRYYEKWHNPNLKNSKGVSLERISLLDKSINRTNWTSSVDNSGGTPSKVNSVSFTARKQVPFTVEPNPFSPDNDGHEDMTTISYSSGMESSFLRIRVFDRYGRLQRTIINNSHGFGSGNVTWDGFDDNGKPLKIGIYIILLEFLDDTNGTVNSYKLPVVIAGKL